MIYEIDFRKIRYIQRSKEAAVSFLSGRKTARSSCQKARLQPNMRQYVDNTRDPEPEDVQAHLIRAVPVQTII